MEKTRKIELLEELLKTSKANLRTYNDILNDVPQKYIGEELEKQKLNWGKNVAEEELKFEALGMLLEAESIIDCPECEKEHEEDISCLEAGVKKANV